MEIQIGANADFLSAGAEAGVGVLLFGLGLDIYLIFG